MSAPTPPSVVQVGRRPIIDYVTKDYEGFRQGMLALIPQLLPDWTDRSESDLGVVLIELFAYVADILSYYQDRVATEAFLSTATQRRSVTELLRLIDYQIDPGLAAKALLHIQASGAVDLDATALPYRARVAGIPGEPDRYFEVTRPFKLRPVNNEITLPGPLLAGTTGVELGRTAHELVRGDSIYIEEPMTGIDGKPAVRRSPPLTVVDVRDIAESDPPRDRITWEPALPQSFTTADPRLRGNNVLATHGETVSDEPVYVGDGTPRQSFRLSRRPVTHLLAPRSTGRRRRSQAELEVRVNDVPWQQVDSFFLSGPFDPHYVTTVDENDYLTIRFGTGQRGAIVPPDARVKATYRVGLGRAGNVGPGAINVAVTSLPAVASVTNPFGAQGGAERETTDEAKISGPGSIITQERAVTLQDYELLSKAFPGVGKARARVGLRGGYKAVEVYVVPENAGAVPPPMPSAELKEALRQELEARQPVNRMAGVEVLDPVYVPIDVGVDVHVRTDASASVVKQAVVAALQGLLAFERVDFGSSIRVGDIFATLYPIPGIAYVQLRRLTRRGQTAPVATQTSELVDVALGDREVPYLGQLAVAPFGGMP